MAFPLQFLLETALPQLLTGGGKKKKKHSKKDKSSTDVLGLTYLTIKKFRKVTKQVGKLSTGQKLLAGAAMAAAGLAYLAAREPDAPAEASDPPGATEANHPKELTAQNHAPRKSRKPPKTRPGYE
ncbi:MAG: hypothetical protein M3Y54_20490 [Bacteroidota bacterium]|nr:hypothetical protein [Bacteroidota bacterium]